jgi:long-subunit acyl-CoA synthetase (AMP-forming)
VAFVVVVREPWTMENGMLTPTMKIKRNVIEDFYNRKMDEWFEQKRKVIWEF